MSWAYNYNAFIACTSEMTILATRMIGYHIEYRNTITSAIPVAGLRAYGHDQYVQYTLSQGLDQSSLDAVERSCLLYGWINMAVNMLFRYQWSTYASIASYLVSFFCFS